MHEDGDVVGYAGNENVGGILLDLGIIVDIPDTFSDQNDIFKDNGCFVGEYTMEVDMFKKMDANGLGTIKKIYIELTNGGARKLKNFNDALDGEDYWGALSKIETSISKGRFAQRLASEMTEDMIPGYVSEGIAEAIKIVKEQYE